MRMIFIEISVYDFTGWSHVNEHNGNFICNNYVFLVIQNLTNVHLLLFLVLEADAAERPRGSRRFPPSFETVFAYMAKLSAIITTNITMLGTWSPRMDSGIGRNWRLLFFFHFRHNS